MQVGEGLYEGPQLSAYPQPRGFSPVQQEPRVPRNQDGKQSKTVKTVSPSIEKVNANDKRKDNSIKSKKDSKMRSTIDKPSQTIKIFSTNGAGVINGKVDSLNSEIKAAAANIVTIQETHCTRKGRIQMPVGFVTFEAIRKAKHGGTLCAIHQD